MSIKRIIAVVAIFLCTCAAWIILGAVTLNRSGKMDEGLSREVKSLFDGSLDIDQPSIYYAQPVLKTIQDNSGLSRNVWETQYDPITLDASDVTLDVKLDPRKKGVLWFPTYKVSFKAQYVFRDTVGLAFPLKLLSTLQSTDAVYDNVRLVVNGKEIANILPLLQKKDIQIPRSADGLYKVELSYDASGLEFLNYRMSPGYDAISEINNMNLKILTDFDKYDFPEGSMSPTTKVKTERGWELTWQFKKAVTGKDIGLVIPNKVNPGELVSRVTFFAPVPLLFFFVILMILSVLMKVNIHPMNYFFLAASFFSFHLIYSYFSDHINIYLTFAIASLVSMALTASYLRLFAPPKFAFVYAPLAQLLYLVFFSFSFFFKGSTGMICTIVSVLTLFVLMQITGKIDWQQTFAKKQN